MDKYPAQQTDLSEEASNEVPPPQTPAISPIKKILPLIIGGVVLLIVLSSLVLLSAGKRTADKANFPTPTVRPTATPILVPTMPETSPTIASFSSTISVTPTEEKIGRLSFIREGDIYNSDLASFSLLVKNATPAADKLSWSPQGNFLSWRMSSKTATPSSLMIYDRVKKSSQIVTADKNGTDELIDYAWAPDENGVVLLSRSESYTLSLFSLFYPRSASPSGFLVKRDLAIKQVLWSDKETLFFLGSDGITSINISNNSSQLLVATTSAFLMKLSPDHKKLLYSTGDSKRSDLFILNLESGTNRKINSIPQKIDKGNLNFPDSVFSNGFIPYALFMPGGESLLVGYHYLQYMPLVGIYDLKENTFSAISLFALSSSDVMVDELRLLGARVINLTEKPSWQISLFTLEDNAKLSLIRVIPNASSPTFFGNDILPSGNLF